MYTKYFSGLTVQNDKKKSRSQSCAAARFFFPFFFFSLNLLLQGWLVCTLICLSPLCLTTRMDSWTRPWLVRSRSGILIGPPTPGRRAQTARRRLDSSSGFRTLRSIMGSPPGNRGVISAAAAARVLALVRVCKRKKNKKSPFNIKKCPKFGNLGIFSCLFVLWILLRHPLDDVKAALSAKTKEGERKKCFSFLCERFDIVEIKASHSQTDRGHRTRQRLWISCHSCRWVLVTGPAAAAETCRSFVEPRVIQRQKKCSKHKAGNALKKKNLICNFGIFIIPVNFSSPWRGFQEFCFTRVPPKPVDGETFGEFCSRIL